ncbi:hypothetical protein [Clostridium ihumii]|nr:hypothetical protein [Clostridium ihumii]
MIFTNMSFEEIYSESKKMLNRDLTEKEIMKISMLLENAEFEGFEGDE